MRKREKKKPMEDWTDEDWDREIRKEFQKASDQNVLDIFFMILIAICGIVGFLLAI